MTSVLSTVVNPGYNVRRKNVQSKSNMAAIPKHKGVVKHVSPLMGVKSAETIFPSVLQPDDALMISLSLAFMATVVRNSIGTVTSAAKPMHKAKWVPDAYNGSVHESAKKKEKTVIIANDRLLNGRLALSITVSRTPCQLA